MWGDRKELIPKEHKGSAGYACTLHWADGLTGIATPTFIQLYNLNRHG